MKGETFGRYHKAVRIRSTDGRCCYWRFTLLDRICLSQESELDSKVNVVLCSWNRLELLRR